MKTFAVSAFVLCTCATGVQGARADDISADEIARRALSYDVFGLEDARIKARLVLVDEGGAREERAFEAVTKKHDGVFESVIRFTAPPSVAGMAFLLVEHTDAADEQYVYLPRLKSTRRIGTSGEREASFMGSDFTYADLERRSIRDASYQRLADESIGQDPCFHIVATPKKQTRYSKVESWIRQRDSIVLRMRMFGMDGSPEKTTFSRRIRKVDDRSVVVESHTENERTHHQTDLVIDDIDLSAVTADSAFLPAALAH
jgi:hypothetical protein